MHDDHITIPWPSMAEMLQVRDEPAVMVLGWSGKSSFVGNKIAVAKGLSKKKSFKRVSGKKKWEHHIAEEIS